MYKGEEFDSMHKKVLKKYYEEAANDFDELTEWTLALEVEIGNPNFSAKRIGYKEYQPETVNKDIAVDRTDILLDQVVVGFNLILKAIDEDCPIQQGLANYLQTRLEYWGKELAYFNAGRSI
jgi:DNA-binding ferritin-like protein